MCFADHLQIRSIHVWLEVSSRSIVSFAFVWSRPADSPERVEEAYVVSAPWVVWLIGKSCCFIAGFDKVVLDGQSDVIEASVYWSVGAGL